MKSLPNLRRVVLNSTINNQESTISFDDSNQILHAAQGGPVLPRLRNVLLYDGRALRTRRHGHDFGAGDDARLSVGAAVVLVHSRLVGVGRADPGHAGGGRFLSLDPRRL